MNLIATATARLESARDLTAILGAACDAFELMLPVIEDQQDPAGGAFTDFVMAAAYAANGRDAILFAPSLSAGSSRRSAAGHRPSALAAAIAVAELSRVVAERLGKASQLAVDAADLKACVEGRRQASRIAEVLGRAPGQ
jgi:hypothetical protein